MTFLAPPTSGSRIARALLLLLLPLKLSAFPIGRYPEAGRFIDRLTEEGFPRAELVALLKEAKIEEAILRAVQRPAEAMPWHRYRKLFLTENRIQEGVNFAERHRALLEEVAGRYGVPPEVVVAILGVETLYGQRSGRHRIIDALSTLAFAYPKRSRFFTEELRHLLWLSREEGFDPLALKGSYAGAMGWPQFIPSSYRHYAVDFDRDGKRDLWRAGDAVASIAHYLQSHGWRKGEPVATPIAPVPGRLVGDGLHPPEWTVGALRHAGVPVPARFPDHLQAMVVRLEGERGPQYWLAFHNFYVITRYNHSPLYAMAVYQLSRAIRSRLHEVHPDHAGRGTRSTR